MSQSVYGRTVFIYAQAYAHVLRMLCMWTSYILVVLTCLVYTIYVRQYLTFHMYILIQVTAAFLGPGRAFPSTARHRN